jgi:hypothetical protein
VLPLTIAFETFVFAVAGSEREVEPCVKVMDVRGATDICADTGVAKRHSSNITLIISILF